jgi:hypothetical protein
MNNIIDINTWNSNHRQRVQLENNLQSICGLNEEIIRDYAERYIIY